MPPVLGFTRTLNGMLLNMRVRDLGTFNHVPAWLTVANTVAQCHP